MSSYRILIVEDELIVAEGLSRLLDEEGYEVVGISDTGEGAIKLALETAPDLVLVDIKLKGAMDGIEAADKIKRLQGAAIVYLTALSDRALFDRAKQTGPERYLCKPVSRIELTRTVELVLYKHEMDIRLREAEERYRSLVEDSFDGILVRKGTVIAFANNRLHEMLGYEQGELIGKDHWTVCHPGYEALVRDRARARMSGESVTDHHEIKLQAKDGTVLDGEIRSKAIFLNGEAIVQSWVRDVSDQKRAQAEIRLLGETVRQTHEGIAMVDVAGNVIFVNDAFAAMHGYSAEELKGKNLSIFHTKEQMLEVAAANRLLQETGQFSGEIWHTRRDGTAFPTLMRNSLLRDQQGNPVGMIGTARDISDLKRSQEQLQLEKQRFELLVESAPFGLAIIGRDGTFQYINPKFVETFGYAPEEIPNGVTWFRKTFPDSVDRYNAISAWILDASEAKPGEQRPRTFCVVCKDGEKKDILFRPVQLSNGQHMMTTEDITERTRAEKALTISEANYRTIFNSMEDAIFVHDASTGEILDVNAKMCEMWGYSAEEARSLTVEDLSSGDPTYSQVEALRAIREATAGQSKLLEWRGKDKNGRLFWLEVNLKRCVINDRYIVLAVVRDITDRKKMEEAVGRERDKAQSYLDIAGVMIVVIDCDQKIALANRKTCELLGCEERDIIGKNWFDTFVPKRARDITKGAFRDLMAGKIEPWEYAENPLLTMSGEKRLMAWHNSVIRDENGRIVAALSSGEDITERKRAEDALQESEARFREFAEAMPQVVFEIDAFGNFTFLNRSGLALAGYDHEDMDRGMKPTDLIAPEDQERMLENFGRVLQGESTSGNQYTVVSKDGTRVPVATYTSPIMKAGQVVGIRGICVDISKLREAEAVLQRSQVELEQLVADRTSEVEFTNEQLRKEILERINTQEALALSEQRFRAIFETAKSCVYLKDTSLKYTLVNPFMATLLDLPESEILGKTDFDLFGTSAGEHLSGVDKRVLRGEVVEEEHTRLVQGVPITFLDVRAPLTNAQGEITGICGTARNITERKVVSSSPASLELTSGSHTMTAVISAARLVASTESTILITGESGTGKDRLARYIHNYSARSSGPFYTINCAAIPSELAESELFGHEAGAFTGATRRKRGLLEIAEGGTILLNEIGDMPLQLQSKLLSFLDLMSFTRLGGEKSVTVNVRLIAATNRNLAEEISAGHFRQDLFYRLNIFSIQLPPLRERLEDIPMLVKDLLSEVAPDFRYSGTAHQWRRMMEILTDYSWPGNIRELRNVLERAVIVSKGGSLKLEHLQVAWEKSPDRRPRVSMPIDGSLPEVLGGIERSLIEEALQISYGNKKKAAKLLGVSRFALARHMEKLGIRTFADNLPRNSCK